MRGTRRMLGAISTTAALIAGLTFATTGTAHAQGAADLPTKTFTFSTGRAGDCTMFSGAKWILRADGKAKFAGRVTSSDDNDAWLMWAKLKDGDGAVLGWLKNSHANPTNRTKFVMNMPSHNDSYRWTIDYPDAEFDPRLFPAIEYMALSSHC
ncbi:DUF6294 family protein [Nonomuraea guangzhouensis]|uniref:DUF6294 family protein n=1 Tax=Nonomuraea guangzhouensis TaxID=1291555 RepID=A0ABW4GUI1_9ACTN|nr:DUF6294 family protein [Nonomuraea guangzhouensis]